MRFLTKFIDKKRGKTTIREQFQKIKNDLKDPNIDPKVVYKYKEKLDKTIKMVYDSMYEAAEKGTFVARQFQSKFTEIPYTYSTTGLGLKKKRKLTRKHKRKRTKKLSDKV